MNPAQSTSEGRIVQIIGPVVDVEFSENVPPIYSALELSHEGERKVFEVAQHLGSGRVRAISMAATEGLKRGLSVRNPGPQVGGRGGNPFWGRFLIFRGGGFGGQSSFPPPAPR